MNNLNKLKRLYDNEYDYFINEGGVYLTTQDKLKIVKVDFVSGRENMLIALRKHLKKINEKTSLVSIVITISEFYGHDEATYYDLYESAFEGLLDVYGLLDTYTYLESEGL